MQRFKYGRTFHLPFSQQLTGDDKLHPNPTVFNAIQTVITPKMDGENTCLYHDGFIHARSIDSTDHPSRQYVKNMWNQKAHLLPPNWRIYGENLYAQHSIPYNNLTAYFQAFAIYNEHNIRLDYDDFTKWCDELQIYYVKPIIIITSFDNLQHAQSAFQTALSQNHEGIVITTYKGFPFDDMSLHTAKAVRENHVQTDQHWMHKPMTKNTLLKQ